MPRFFTQGLRWRVGDGRKVEVWKDPWLLTPYDFKVISRNPFLAHSIMESDLIGPQTRTWKLNLLENLLMERDNEKMLKIPLYLVAVEDTLIWNYKNSG